MNLLESALTVSRKRLRPSSLAIYRSWYGRYETRLSEIHAEHPVRPGQESPEQLLKALQDIGDYQNQKRVLALLGWIYDTLQRNGHPLQDPTPALKGLYTADHRSTHHAMDESWPARLAHAAAQQASGWKATRLVAMVLLLADTALKTSELITLERGDVHGAPQPSTIDVGRGLKGRILSLGNDAAKALQQWLAVHPAPGSPCLFVRDASGRPMEPSTVWRQLARVTEAAGPAAGKRAGTGTIRANKALELTQQGRSSQEIAQFLGHRQEGSTGELLARVRGIAPPRRRARAKQALAPASAGTPPAGGTSDAG